MAMDDADPNVLENVVNSATEKLQDLPASSPVETPQDKLQAPGPYRLFNRQRSLHEILGGGKPADVILWRKKYISAAILVGATVAWFLFEYSGFSLLSIVSDVLLLLIVGLFVWANAAVITHWPKPRIPELQLSEEMVANFAAALRVEINKALAVAHDIALGKDFKLFLKVVAVLWGLSLVGGWFHFLTLLYICVVLCHTVPVIYEKYEEQIDSYAKVALDEAHKHYRTVNAAVAKKFPNIAFKEKKAQ